RDGHVTGVQTCALPIYSPSIMASPGELWDANLIWAILPLLGRSWGRRCGTTFIRQLSCQDPNQESSTTWVANSSKERFVFARFCASLHRNFCNFSLPQYVHRAHLSDPPFFSEDSG